jgi:hypothetical protein
MRIRDSERKRNVRTLVTGRQILEPQSSWRFRICRRLSPGTDRIDVGLAQIADGRLLASPIVRRPLLDERVQPFLTIFGGRDKRKALGSVLDRAAEIGIDGAHESVAADLHDA